MNEDPPRGADNDGEEDERVAARRRAPSRRSRPRTRGRASAGDPVEHDDLGGPGDSSESAPSDRVFIAGVEAAVAAELADDEDQGYRRFEPDPPPEAYAPPEELLDWTEPPTGQIPRVLLGDDDAGAGLGTGPRGPVWREQGTDWDDDESSLADLTGEGESVIQDGGGSVDDEDPFEFNFDDQPGGATVVYGPTLPTETGESARTTEEEDDPEIAWQSWSGQTGRGSSDGLTALGEMIEGSGAARPTARRHSRRRGLGGRAAGGAEAAEEADSGELAPRSRLSRRARVRAGLGGGGAGAGGAGGGGGVGLAAGAAAAGGVAAAGAGAAAAATTATAATAATARAGATATMTAPRTGARRRVEEAQPRREVSAPSGPGRNVGVATVTGVGIGVLALICFFLGSVATLALATIAVTAAGAECFAGMRRAGYRPATLVALIGIPTLLICAYLKGPEAVEIVLVVFTVVTLLWYLAGVSREDPVSNIGATLAGFLWVGLLGSSAGLLLAPAMFPKGNGVALLLGGIVPTVGYDVAAFAAGALFGKHKLAPSISPGKTWEGAIAGSILAIVLAVAVISQIKPWTVSSALAAGVIVVVLAPIGDLCESMFKRSLGLKDMGSLLPAHGGVLDRIDALLLVLPAIYLFVRIAHIS